MMPADLPTWALLALIVTVPLTIVATAGALAFAFDWMRDRWHDRELRARVAEYRAADAAHLSVTPPRGANEYVRRTWDPR